jgi:hypothetical protein
MPYFLGSLSQNIGAPKMTKDLTGPIGGTGSASPARFSYLNGTGDTLYATIASL